MLRAPASPPRDFDWIRRAIPEGSRAYLVDVTSAHATLSLMGPKARDLLAAIRRLRSLKRAFPFANGRHIEIGGVCLYAIRISYVGELGWGACTFRRAALGVYELLLEVGKGYGLANAGYRAIESLRLEKGYRAWGSDIGPDHTPLEAGLGWAVKLRKNISFKGRDSLVAQQAAPLAKRLPASRWTIPRSACSAAKPSTATAGAPVGSPPAVGATRSGRTSATATCAPATASPTISLRRRLRARSGGRARPLHDTTGSPLRSRDEAGKELMGQVRKDAG